MALSALGDHFHLLAELLEAIACSENANGDRAGHAHDQDPVAKLGKVLDAAKGATSKARSTTNDSVSSGPQPALVEFSHHPLGIDSPTDAEVPSPPGPPPPLQVGNVSPGLTATLDQNNTLEQLLPQRDRSAKSLAVPTHEAKMLAGASKLSGDDETGHLRGSTASNMSFRNKNLRTTASSVTASSEAGRAPGQCYVDDSGRVRVRGEVPTDVGQQSMSTFAFQRRSEKKRMSQRVMELMNAVNENRRSQFGMDGRVSVMTSQDYRARSRRVIKHPRFEAFMSALIATNALIMGIGTDWKIRHQGEENSVLRILDIVLLCMFIIELAFRMYAEGFIFFNRLNPTFYWNMFDCVVIGLCIVDELAHSSINSKGDGKLIDVSVLRLLRLLRLARALRVVRVIRFFRDLRVMIAGILSSIKSLVWAGVLLSLWTYLFAVCIIELVFTQGNYDLTKGEFALYYHSLFRTMYTLILSVIAGIDWGKPAEPLYRINIMLAVCYTIYVSFAVLCVLNIITGVFVENANKLTKVAENEAILEELEKRKVWLEDVKHLFDQALTMSGVEEKMDADTFVDLVADVHVQAIFRKLGIELETHHARGLFCLLDFDGNGEVDSEEFAMGLDQLHGQAKSIDVVRLRHQLKTLTRMMADMHSHLEIRSSVIAQVERQDSKERLQARRGSNEAVRTLDSNGEQIGELPEEFEEEPNEASQVRKGSS